MKVARRIGQGLLLGALALLLAACPQTPRPDTERPTVTLSSPQDGATFSTAQVTVRGTAQDNVGVVRVTYQLNGGSEQNVPITPGTNVPFQFPITLQQGQNTLTVNAYDAAGNKGSAEITLNHSPDAIHTLQGTVVSENAGGPVAGSRVRAISQGIAWATATTGPDGTFTLTNLPPGVYRLELEKEGMAGSVMVGVRVPETKRVWLIQRPAFDPAAAKTPPELRITDHNGNPLEGQTFTNAIPYRVQVAPGSSFPRPIRLIYVALGRTPGAAFIYNNPTSSRAVWSEVEDTGNRTLSGLQVAGFGSRAGEAVNVEVVAYDFNLNRIHYLIPITFVNTSPAQDNPVSAPTGVAASSITLKDAVGFFASPAPLALPVPLGRGEMGTLRLEPQAAPPGSNLYVEVRWCYTPAQAPFAFHIERSTDGTNWTRVATVGGGRSASCPADPFSRPFFFRDNSPELEVGVTYHYRVVAQGTGEAASAPVRTTPLPPYHAPLIAPADEAVGVSRTPDFVVGHPQLDAGADGAAYILVLWDTLTGREELVAWYTLDGAFLFVEFGTGPDGNGIPPGEALVYGFPEGTFTVFTDTAGLLDPARPSVIPVDLTQGRITLPYDFDGLAVLPKLQAFRTYAWQLWVSFAYRYEDNRISAYSIHTWPSTAAPFRISRPGTEVFDFTTGE